YLLLFLLVYFFFFSSRRRHTRSKRDWSSDVCSSDLFIIKYPLYFEFVLLLLFFILNSAFLLFFSTSMVLFIYNHSKQECYNTFSLRDFFNGKLKSNQILSRFTCWRC